MQKTMLNGQNSEKKQDAMKYTKTSMRILYIHKYILSYLTVDLNQIHRLF